MTRRMYSYVNFTCGQAIEAEDDQDAHEAARFWAEHDAQEGHGLSVFPTAELPHSVIALLNEAHGQIQVALQELRGRYPGQP